jgi:hypothetical protein
MSIGRRLFAAMFSLSALASISGMARVNAQIFGFSPLFAIAPKNGSNGKIIAPPTRIRAVNPFGFWNEFLYQYRVLVNVGSARMNV